MDQLDIRYKDLREQLYCLGFHQSLPIGALGIVSALLEDLIKVTDSYKQSKQTIKNLLEEKNAWELGIEPYKCDNSRLLSENNALHLEAIRERDHHNKKLIELKQTIRNLEVDKSYLEDHCFELVSKIREMEQQGRSSKYREDGKMLVHKKAFISTVRSGNFIPHPNALPPKHLTNRSDGKYSDESHIEIVKLQNDIHALKDETDMLKKQLSGRDREIARLHNELTGGRPAAALGRDCCYRGIDTLAEDMKLLQKQLIATKNELKDSLERQHEAKLRAIKLDEEKTKLARELKEMEEIALKVQDEANAKLKAKEKYLNDIEGKLNESLDRVAFLEADGKKLGSSTLHQTKDIKNMKAALKKMNDENDNLLKNIKDLMERESKYGQRIKELSQKNCKLEEKVKALEMEQQLHNQSEKRLISKATITEPEDKAAFSKEKLFYQTEYLRRLNKPAYERELENVQSQLAERDIEVHLLKEQLAANPPVHKPNYCHSSISVQSVMNRMEREAHLSKLDIERLTAEKDEFRKKFEDINDAYQNEHREYERQTFELSNALKQLESENRMLNERLQMEAPNHTKILSMKEEMASLRRKIDEQNLELSSLTTSYNQIKLLQEQTEKALLDHQNRLFQAENKIEKAESELSAKDSKNEFTNRTVGNLQTEISKLKNIIETIERDKNQMALQLDSKTEQIFQMETELTKLKLDNAELNSKNVELRRQMSNKSHESVEKTNTIERTSKERESLLRQMEHLKTLNENLSAENSRLNHEIIDSTCAYNDTKKRLMQSEQEVQRLSNHLEDYLQKVKDAEDLLMRKDEERAEILENYKCLTQDSAVLEGTNHSLEMEAADAKRCLIEAEEKLQYLQDILNAREDEINAYNHQIAELSNQLTTCECGLNTCFQRCDALQEDTNAIKELCSKLDNEKDKLKEELSECSNIRRKLEQDNEKLRKELKFASNAPDHGVNEGHIEGLQELLTATRSERDQLRVTIGERDIEIKRLRSKIQELKDKVEEETKNASQRDELAKEYLVQIQELQHKLTADRFAAAASAKKETDEYDRNKNSNEKFPNVNKRQFLNSQTSSANQSVNSKNSKTTNSITNIKARVRRLISRSAPAPHAQRKSQKLKQINMTDLDYNSDSSEQIKAKTQTIFSKAALNTNQKSTPLSTSKSDKNYVDSAVVPNPNQNEQLGSNQFLSSENRKSHATMQFNRSSDCFNRFNSMTDNRKEHRENYVLNKASCETSLGSSDEVSSDEELSSFPGNRSFLSQETLESSLPCIEQSIDHCVAFPRMPSAENSISTNLTKASASYDSIEDFLTCTSSSSLLQHNRNANDRRKNTKSQSNFDPSHLPPPPRVVRGPMMSRVSQSTELNIKIVSHVGALKQFTGTLTLNSTK